MFKKVLLILGVLLLTGCGRSDLNAQADNKVLCDANMNAYHVRQGLGDSSFIRPVPSGEAICATFLKERK